MPWTRVGMQLAKTGCTDFSLKTSPNYHRTFVYLSPRDQRTASSLRSLQRNQSSSNTRMIMSWELQHITIFSPFFGRGSLQTILNNMVRRWQEGQRGCSSGQRLPVDTSENPSPFVAEKGESGIS